MVHLSLATALVTAFVTKAGQDMIVANQFLAVVVFLVHILLVKTVTAEHTLTTSAYQRLLPQMKLLFPILVATELILEDL